MLAKVLSCAVVGLEGAIVEIDISPGLPSFTIVGLPDTAVQEARERVRAAIRNSGSTFPMGRIVVNLALCPLRLGATMAPNYSGIYRYALISVFVLLSLLVTLRQTCAPG